MRAYLINLARSRDRRAHMTAQLDKIGMDYELVPAIDGHDLDLDDQSIIAPSFLSKVKLATGAAGCTLSHIAVYKRIIEDGLDMALVLEDDIVLPADLDALADAVGKELVGAEVALLSVSSHEPLKVRTQGSVPLPSSRFLTLPVDVFRVKSGGAYVITRAACERIIEGNHPLRAAADAWGLFYSEGMLDRVRCVAPLSVDSDYNFSSTIGSYSLGSGVLGRAMAVILRYRIPVLQQVMARRRQSIFSKKNVLLFTDDPFVSKPSRLDLSSLRRFLAYSSMLLGSYPDRTQVGKQRRACEHGGHHALRHGATPRSAGRTSD